MIFELAWVAPETEHFENEFDGQHVLEIIRVRAVQKGRVLSLLRAWMLIREEFGKFSAEMSLAVHYDSAAGTFVGNLVGV